MEATTLTWSFIVPWRPRHSARLACSAKQMHRALRREHRCRCTMIKIAMSASRPHTCGVIMQKAFACFGKRDSDANMSEAPLSRPQGRSLSWRLAYQGDIVSLQPCLETHTCHSGTWHSEDHAGTLVRLVRSTLHMSTPTSFLSKVFDYGSFR